MEQNLQEEKRIRRVNRELKYQGAIVDVYSDTIETPDGNIAYWDYVEHRKGAAAVVPVTPEGRILMVRQYRNALDRYTIELPAGCRDSLTEDTMLSLKTTVAFCNEFIDVYLATDLKPGKQHLDPEEFIEVRAYEPEELLEKIYAGVIQDSKTVAGILAYCYRYRNNMK